MGAPLFLSMSLHACLVCGRLSEPGDRDFLLEWCRAPDSVSLHQPLVKVLRTEIRARGGVLTLENVATRRGCAFPFLDITQQNHLGVFASPAILPDFRPYQCS